MKDDHEASDLQAEFDKLMIRLSIIMGIFLSIVIANMLFAGYILWSML